MLFCLLTYNIGLGANYRAKDIGSTNKGEPFSLIGETPEQKAERMKWWSEARFGMFIHWGLYSTLEGKWKGKDSPFYAEWIMDRQPISKKEYTPLTNQFNPTKYKAEKWVKLAHKAGMKYLVITSKHHEGFQLWDSKYSTYDVAATPYKKDLLKPLSEATKKYDIRFGLYYSILDWHHPDQALKTEAERIKHMPRYFPYVTNQVFELLNTYDNLDLLWFDGEWIKEWRFDRGPNENKYGKMAYKALMKYKPSLIINERILGYRNSRYADYYTPEQFIPKVIKGSDATIYWESCMTLNDTWGYRRSDKNWKPTKLVIHKLIDIVSRDGNFLLNIGPKGDGTIPKGTVKIFKEVGQWMKINGEAIHGTRGNPFPVDKHKRMFPYGRITVKEKENKMYLSLTKWPYTKPYKPYYTEKYIERFGRGHRIRERNVYTVSWKKKIANFFKKDNKGEEYKYIKLRDFENGIKRVYALKNKKKDIPFKKVRNTVTILSKHIPKSKMVTVLAIEYEGELKK